MLKLCGFHISNYFCKARIAMLEKGLDFELDPSCRPSQAPEFLARTPMGKVPFLELDGGATLSESQVICEYLEDAYPAKPLYPADPRERARVRELIVLIELHVELVARRGDADEDRNGEKGIEYRSQRDDIAQVLLQRAHFFIAACAALRSSATRRNAGRSPSMAM